MTNMTFIKPCSPHSWAHAPTVGYYACINCRETVMYDDPRYIEIEAEQAKQIAAMTNEQPEQITEAEQLAVPDWMHQLASKIVLGRHGVGNAGVLIQRAFTERTADLVADNAKLREALGWIHDYAIKLRKGTDDWFDLVEIEAVASQALAQQDKPDAK